MEERLDIADFLLIAERVLEVDAKRIARVARLPEAESALAAPFAGFGDEEFYPDPIERAAICCSRIVRNHPLPDGNKRTGYECMLEMLARAGFDWVQPEDDPGSDAAVIDGLAARTVEEDDFIDWVRQRVEEEAAAAEDEPDQQIS